jgi:hypothetical protein
MARGWLHGLVDSHGADAMRILYGTHAAEQISAMRQAVQ